MLKLFCIVQVIVNRAGLWDTFKGLNNMGKGVFYYAVRRGRAPGVYTSWEKCKEQVDKFHGAIYKKFALEDDAWEFVGVKTLEGACLKGSAEFSSERTYEQDTSQQNTSEQNYTKKRSQTQTSEELLQSKRCRTAEPCTSDTEKKFAYMGEAAVVYTDGCCTSNGRDEARAGLGVYWGPDHPLNVSERLEGRQTNQRAEIQAACRAIEQAKKQDIKKLIIYTDSKFTINDSEGHEAEPGEDLQHLDAGHTKTLYDVKTEDTGLWPVDADDEIMPDGETSLNQVQGVLQCRGQVDLQPVLAEPSCSLINVANCRKENHSNASLLKQVKKLSSKVERLENRAKQCNIKVVGIPSSVEEEKLLDYINKIFADILSVSDFEQHICAVKAFRKLPGMRHPNHLEVVLCPTVIATMPHPEARATVLKAAKKKREIVYEGVKLELFPDVSKITVNKRKKLLEFKEKFNKLGVVTRLYFPAKLQVQLGSETHLFTDVDDVASFYDKCKPSETVRQETDEP